MFVLRPLLVAAIPVALAGCFFNGNGQLQGEAKDNGNGNASSNGNGSANPSASATGAVPDRGVAPPSTPPSASAPPASPAGPADPPAIAKAKAACAAAGGSADNYQTAAEAFGKAQGTWYICASDGGVGFAGVQFEGQALQWLTWDGVGLAPAAGLAPLSLTPSDPFSPPIGRDWTPESAITSGDPSMAKSIVLVFERDPVRLYAFDTNNFSTWFSAVPFAR